MASLFTRIIDGELPGRFLWKDDLCVAFLTIAPITPGHTLVVPREPVDHWLDAPPPLLHHLTDVGATVGRALLATYQPPRVGMMIAGLEVPHLHLHVLAIETMADMDFRRADPTAPAEALDDAHTRLSGALRELGLGANVPD
ncbi:MAG: HIT family protein [Acidimicrobiia bacterium]|nr:HIT family protein [Acidimicrobiia bacterium]